MSSSSILEPDAIANREDHEQIDKLVSECAQQTISALHQSGMATEHEARDLIRFLHDVPEDAPPVDVLVTLAKMQGSDEEHMSPAITRLANAISGTIPSPPPVIPFAGKLIAPSAFYESFQNILSLGRALLAPVIYAEDTDAIGVAAVNPFAAQLLASEIHSAVESRFGIQPFMTVARLDYESWTFLLRKHFAL